MIHAVAADAAVCHVDKYQGPLPSSDLRQENTDEAEEVSESDESPNTVPQ